MSKDCRIIVLNFNGRDLLEKYLPSVMRSAQVSGNRVKVTVLDNRSTDDSEAVVAKKFPDAEFVNSSENAVFCSYNNYAETVTDEYLILLNNDIRVEEGFVDPLIAVLENDPLVFFSAPMTVQDGTDVIEGCRSRLEMRFGLPWGAAKFPGYEKAVHEPGVTMQTGFGAFRRTQFLELGGFDRLFLPGTMEDADLCFRGWRQGWSGRYCPQSIVHHMGQASFKRAFGSSGIRRLNRRNLYLFTWKNIRDPWMLTAHLLWTPLHLLRYMFKGEWDFLKGFFDALGCLGKALKRRRATRNEKSVVPDAGIFEVSKRMV